MLLAEIFTRISWAATIIGIGVALWFTANRWILLRAARHSTASASDGVPSILYFTTPACIPCKNYQRPAIQRLQEVLGDCLKVVEIDATVQPEMASQWGVLSVPTMFILDEQGKPRHVNHGLTSTEKLLKQLENL